MVINVLRILMCNNYCKLSVKSKSKSFWAWKIIVDNNYKTKLKTSHMTQFGNTAANE